jgi:predicted nucleic acid-binding protein
MSGVDLIADTNVISYLFGRSPLGLVYAQLIGHRTVGITGHTLSELRAGTIIGRWGERRRKDYTRFLEAYEHVPCCRGMAEVCGALRGLRRQAGAEIEWADAWAAACAMWLGLPLVTHDRDLEGIPGLRVITAHDAWQVGEATTGYAGSTGIWTGESTASRIHLQ